MEFVGTSPPEFEAEWNRRLLRLVMEHPAPVVIHDGRSVLHANRRVAELFGFGDPAAMVGASVHDLVHPDDREKVRERIDDAFRRGVGADIADERFVRADGSTINVEVATQPVVLDGRTTILVWGRDVTRERELEESLERELRWRRALTEVATSANAAATLFEAITPCLEAVARAAFPLLDSAATSVACHAFLRDRVDPVRVAEPRFWKFKEPGTCLPFRESLDGPRNFEEIGFARRILATGKPVWSSDIAHDPAFPQAEAAASCGLAAGAGCPIALGNRIVGVLECFADSPREPDGLLLDALANVGRQLSHVLERQHAQEERDRLLREIRGALDVANHAVSQRDEFLSVAAHELYTPLTSLELVLRGMSKAGTDPAGNARLLEIARRQSNRLVRLVGSLLDITQIDAGRLRLAPEEVNLSDLTREVFARFAIDLDASGSHAEVDAPQAVVGWWDRARIDQVIANLAANAIKYGAGKPIRVSVRKDDDTAYLTVIDGGIGIASNRLARIFERYERAASPKQFGGLGLGLFLVREIVERHGGRVSIESEVGRGSRVTVALPLSGNVAATS